MKHKTDIKFYTSRRVEQLPGKDNYVVHWGIAPLEDSALMAKYMQKQLEHDDPPDFYYKWVAPSEVANYLLEVHGDDFMRSSFGFMNMLIRNDDDGTPIMMQPVFGPQWKEIE